MKTCFSLFLLIFSNMCFAQDAKLTFPEKCLGTWEGVMKIYKYDQQVDSVKVQFTAARTDSEYIYVWRTEYISDKYPMVKDYKLVVEDEATGQYIIDEGNDVKLNQYRVGNKMSSLFEVKDVFLTSTTELVGDQLIFEVTSGKKLDKVQGITNYSYTNTQRVVYKKISD